MNDIRSISHIAAIVHATNWRSIEIQTTTQNEGHTYRQRALNFNELLQRGIVSIYVYIKLQFTIMISE